MNLTIRGRAWIDGALKDRSVKIEDGRIAAIDDGITGDSADALVLGPREILLPSATDLQCAMRDWAEAERETVETCTKAALAGGVTTVGDQANTVPRIHKLELVEKRARDVAATAWCDFGITGHPPSDTAELDRYRGAGAFSVQFFPWDLRPWRYPRDTDDSQVFFKRCADLGLKGLSLIHI